MINPGPRLAGREAGAVRPRRASPTRRLGQGRARGRVIGLRLQGLSS